MSVPQPRQWLIFILDQVSNSAAAEESSSIPFFKVRPEQRKVNPQAFDPIAFPFGPYHASFSLSSDANYYKLQAVKRLVGQQRFETLVSRIEKKEPSIRALYVEGGDHLASIDARTFACLLAVDAVAILAAYIKTEVFRACVGYAIQIDALLLENQIPLFVLEYALESIDSEVVNCNLEQIVHAHSNYSPFWSPSVTCWVLPSTFDCGRSLLSCIYDKLTATSSESKPVSYGSEKSQHKSVRGYCEDDDTITQICKSSASTGCFKSHCVGPSMHPMHPNNIPSLPTASHLRTCGIKFRACNGSFTGITFDNQGKILSLPRIAVLDETERFLLNLLAYETTSRLARDSPVSSYVAIMDYLLDNEEDVGVLVNCGVITNYLGSYTEVAAMWSKLCIHVPVTLTKADKIVVEDVNRASKIKCRKWIAAFKETYCEKKPWLLVSIVAATLLLILTFLQTIYTMKQYFQ